MYYAKRAYGHIRYLSETIGSRGSCTPNEDRAAGYVNDQLRVLGVSQVDFEKLSGAPSSYLPYSLAFAAALIGTLIALFAGSRMALAIGGIFNLLGVWAMFAESEFAANWTRWILPTKNTKNIIGVIPPRETIEQRVVLCAHLDTHRTPIFFSTTTWQQLFGGITTAAFLSMAASTLTFLIGALIEWNWLRWAGIPFALIQIFVLALVLSADLTPFSPGANDNASGVGAILGLAEQILKEPLLHTEVNLVFTDCEETGAYGIIDYLNKHSDSLGKDAVYIMLDEVGTGDVKYVLADGLIFKHATHPGALNLANHAASALGLKVIVRTGEAYTDALPATKRGLIALSLCAEIPRNSHWHQMSDRIEFIDLQTLENIHAFTWNILQTIEHTQDNKTT